MKITLRLIVTLVFVAALVATIFSYLQVQNEKDRQVAELTIQSSSLAARMMAELGEPLSSLSRERLSAVLDYFIKSDSSTGAAIYDAQGRCIISSRAIDPAAKELRKYIGDSARGEKEIIGISSINDKDTYLYTRPILSQHRMVGRLLIARDASPINVRLREIWRDNFLRLLILALLIIITTIVVVRWSITGPIAQIADWLRGLRMGWIKGPLDLPPRGDVLGPLANEVALLAKNLTQARASAELEARLRVEAESLWTAERLKEHIRHELEGNTVYVVSNREPYMHIRRGGHTECIVPAGGLVTAIDPIMRACGGTWIAHGSGDADLETTSDGRTLPVPPDEPKYTLRRVWLTKEEEDGYYYGFSNEGIWPLCHITHTRPIFRLDDWVQYQRVNEKFSNALLEELKDEQQPLVIIQDYHFAILPLLLKAKRPEARVAIFWHIPWPNPEAFGICPWQREILLGLLAADLVGFQIQYHCNNFLDTVDRFLESKINREQFSIERAEHTTIVKPFPVSVAPTDLLSPGGQTADTQKSLMTGILKELGFSAQQLGVGVDRIDYTKGIIERFRGLERFFEKHPEFIEKFSFVELGAPSRIHIKKYHDLLNEVEETAYKINWRFQTKEWKPIIYLEAHHNHETIHRYYRAADLCMVTSLHDGMNLVAKEYVASRDDEDGVLILSQFTGASRELPDALIVNPYHTEEVADAVYDALTMDPSERRDRMERMRLVVREFNIYRWAANLVSTLSKIRVKKPIENPG